ncbi:Amphipathic pore-forming peptide precursor [Streptococcus constellatus]|nr:Amphipathic pore-forming peptide precursor [Streptococcus constellatus]
MNTKSLEKFEVLNSEMLASVEGGAKYTVGDCRNAMVSGIVGGAMAGGTAGMPALGIGSLAGAFVGAHLGAIGGGLTCVGGMLWNHV